MPKGDQEYLLYPLYDGGDPLCPACQQPMEMLTFDACGNAPHPDVITFLCQRCSRSERFLVDEN